MIIVLMGVAGSGKTTIGMRLASELGWRFLDADDFHPAANIRKMASGQPLDDADRAPWLAALHAELAAEASAGRNVVLACSALKESYRRVLVGVGPEGEGEGQREGQAEGNGAGLPVRFVHLRGTPALLRQRLRNRSGHFMRDHLLDSQLETLEEPHGALVVDIAESPRRIVEEIRRGLGLGPGAGGLGPRPAGEPPHT
jgi:gluconokinase